MIKTQIQVSDELYKKAKAIAKAKEWSLAEVFRRGLEYMAATHSVDEEYGGWKLPTIECGEHASLTSEELNAILEQERDEYLAVKSGLNQK